MGTGLCVDAEVMTEGLVEEKGATTEKATVTACNHEPYPSKEKSCFVYQRYARPAKPKKYTTEQQSYALRDIKREMSRRR